MQTEKRGGQTQLAAFVGKGEEVGMGSLWASRASPLRGWLGRARNVECGEGLFQGTP